MSRQHRVGRVFLAAAGLALTVSGQAVEPQRTPALRVGDFLDRYAQGDVGAATAFVRLADPALVVKEFEAQAGRWVASEGRAIAGRRLIATTFALDVGRGWLGLGAWLRTRRLIAWGCDQFRSAPVADPAERLWHLAAVALVQGADDWFFLAGMPPSPTSIRQPIRTALDEELSRGHLAHSRARFPAEARFALALAVAADNRSWDVGGFGRDVNTQGSLIAGEIDREYLAALQQGRVLREDGGRRSGGGTTRLAQAHLARVREVQEVGAQYSDLTRLPAVAAEAHLRLALVTLRLADREAALRHLNDAERATTDPDLVYLARLFRGVVRERQGDQQDAIAAYRRALDVVPRAQSATTLLSARLFTVGLQAEAAALADAFFAGGEPPADPWRTFRMGDFRFWSVYMARLRAELK